MAEPKLTKDEMEFRNTVDGPCGLLSILAGHLGYWSAIDQILIQSTTASEGNSRPQAASGVSRPTLHAAKLSLPCVKGRFGHPVLVAQLRRLRPSLLL